jgi:hypothetical protein
LRTIIASLTAIITLTFPGTAASQVMEKDFVCDVTVHLRNSIVSTPGTVERAKLVAKTMFAPIGVNLRWRSSDSEAVPGLAVDMLLAGGEPGEEDPGPLAEAFPFAGSTGHIVIRYDRVHSASGISRELEPLLLAHVMVHEMTHVLQCLDRHSEAGVMKARWTSDDYCDMRWKPLSFTPEDIELIHMGIQMLRSRPQNQLEPHHLGPMH